MDNRPQTANREQWNEFVIGSRGSFLQSWQWGEFQQSEGRKIWRLANEDWQTLLIKYPLPFGQGYLYCPRGPLFVIPSASEESRGQQLSTGLLRRFAPRNDIIQIFLNQIKEIAEKEKVIFLRLDPVGELGLEKFGFKKAPPDYYFSATAASPAIALLKIDFSEEELLQKMKPKTRYNLRLAERKGVKVTVGGNELLDIFYDLLEQTTQREKFKPHLKEHYQKLLDVFGDQIKIFLAQYNHQALAASMVLFFGQTAYYLHGASTSVKRYLMPTYLLHWQAIQEAKKLNCQFYDFGGLAPIDDPKHHWSGLDRFKIGFGAEKVNFLWARDLVFQPIWYQVYNLARRVL